MLYSEYKITIKTVLTRIYTVCVLAFLTNHGLVFLLVLQTYSMNALFAGYFIYTLPFTTFASAIQK